jgi:hypothetical protein
MKPHADTVDLWLLRGKGVRTGNLISLARADGLAAGVAMARTAPRLSVVLEWPGAAPRHYAESSRCRRPEGPSWLLSAAGGRRLT